MQLIIITGDGVTGAFLVAHKDIDKIAFTGSTEIGRKIGAIAGDKIIPCSLELGGKAPNIVFADADIDKAVEGVVTSIFFNQGEVCCAGSRLYIEDSIKEEFIVKLKARTEQLVQGDPLDPKTNIGALISKEQFDKVLNYIHKGAVEGAVIISGGAEKPGKGYFVQPTILEAKDNNICAKEEIFGPVVTVMGFTDYDDLVRRANDTNYGLSAGIWTKDSAKAQRLIKDIKAGTVWVNCYNCFDASAPFGGFKDSGIGSELGEAGLNLYFKNKTVWINND